MSGNGKSLSGSKRVSEQQLHQSFNSSKKKECFWPCPVCNRSFASYLLDGHIRQCVQPSFSSSSQLHTQRSKEQSAVSTARHGSSISVDSFSILQSIQDENPSVPGITNAESRAHLRNATDDFDLQCESGRPSLAVSPGIEHHDLQLEDRFTCTQEDLILCRDRLGGRENTAEVSVDDDRALDCSADKERMSRNFGRSDGHSPDTIKLACRGMTEGPLQSERATVTYTIEITDTNDEQRHLDEILKDGNGRVVQRPPPGFKLYQRQKQCQAKLSMFFKHKSPIGVECWPSVSVLQPGMVLLKNWLNLEQQQRLVQESQNVAHLFHRPITSGGGKYHIYSMCWGPKWNPKTHRYAGNGAERPLPEWMFDLAQKISREAQQHTSVYPSDIEFTPDVALVNFYPVKAEELGVIGLGGHQDLDDSCTMPVVSISVGDSMTFFYRRLPPLSRRKSMIYVSVDEKAARSCEDGDVAHNREQQLILRSGDVLVFGGESRLIYHGTRHVQAGTRPPGLHMVPGRLNFTFRQTDASLTTQKSLS